MRIIFTKKFIVWAVIIALMIVALVLGLVFGLRDNDKSNDNIARAAVVSNGDGCAEIGKEMLEKGGSAVDGAIATLLCEGVMLPQSMGIGGGFVATIYTKSTGKIETLIAREMAPAKATQDMFVGYDEITGAIAGGVPGELLGYWEMHRKYGRLSWKTLFQPIIKLCLEGHRVSRYLASAIKSKESYIRNPASGLNDIFIKDNNELYVEGDTMKREKLGETLTKIAENGVGLMYDGGEIGQMFVEDLQEIGGIITVEDLKNYKVRWSDAYVTANVGKGHKLYTTPLPSSGALLSFMLNVVNELYTTDANIYWHRIIEVFKHAYGLRSNLGDLEMEPDMAPTIQATYDKLLSPDFIKTILPLIKDDQTFNDPTYYGSNYTIKEDHGTANLAVLASNGDAISVTSTINNHFGSKVRSKRTGIILNDEMDDFSTPGVTNSFGVEASPTNYIKPGKIPMSSMCPTIVLDEQGNVQLLTGAAGGTRITTSVATAIIKYLILDESLEQAVNDGRFHHQLVPNRVDAEGETEAEIRGYLSQVGHEVNVYALGSGFAALTAIGAKNGVPEPLYDRRRIGSVAVV